MRMENPEAREFYIRKCADENRGERELKHSIDTELYEHLIHTQEAKAPECLPEAERALAVLGSQGGIADAEAK